MKTANVNAYIMQLFGKTELLSIYFSSQAPVQDFAQGEV